jgi:hypothetical protein
MPEGLKSPDYSSNIGGLGRGIDLDLDALQNIEGETGSEIVAAGILDWRLEGSSITYGLFGCSLEGDISIRCNPHAAMEQVNPGGVSFNLLQLVTKRECRKSLFRR